MRERVADIFPTLFPVPVPLGRSGRIMVLLGAILAFLPAVLTASQAWAAPKLIAPDPVHDFGTVKEGTVVEHAFTVKNTGDAPLNIRVDPG